MASIFNKIIDGSIPATRIYEDDVCIVILDIAPVAKGHALVIPKECWPTVVECPAEVMSHLMKVTRRVDQQLRTVLHAEAVNIVINDGPAAGQEVPHVHIHIIPRYATDGMKLRLPKTSYTEGEIDQYGYKLALV